MKNILYFFFLLIATITVAQDVDDTPKNQLDTLQITGYGNHNTLAILPKTVHSIKISHLQAQNIQSIEDVLNLVSGIDVRTRGGKGVQSDISIRGGNFNQVLVLLNGVAVNNPQTGHHNLDLPIDFSMLTRIEIIEGAAGQSFGVNAYSGVINLITKNPNNEQANSKLSAGQFGYLKTDFDVSHSFKKLSIYNGFTYQRSSGYLSKQKINNTDFYTIKNFINIQYNSPKFPVDFQAGYNQKDFGAHSFYTSKYPWQFEKTKGYFVHLKTKFGQTIKWKASISYKLHYDEFQLFRESRFVFNKGFFIHQKDTAQYAPGVYYLGHNNHKTSVLSAGLKAKYKSKLGISYWNFSVQNNQIFSNVLGETLNQPIEVTPRITYTKYAQRNYAQTGVNHVKKYRSLQFGGGVNALYSNRYGLQLTGGGFINYRQKNFTHYLSVNSASRLPGFTDLYYQGPSNIGNPDLLAETSITYEGGSKYLIRNFFVGTSLFYRQSNGTIDWIKYHPNDKWQPQNLTQLNTFGIELNSYKFFEQGFIKKIRLSYTYLSMHKEKNNLFISKYALDYLKHNLSLNISHKFLFNSTLNWRFYYKERHGQYIDFSDNQYQLFDYQPYFLTHLKWFKKYKKTNFGISIENLFDVHYRDLSYVKMPGRWVIFELNYSLK